MNDQQSFGWSHAFIRTTVISCGRHSFNAPDLATAVKAAARLVPKWQIAKAMGLSKRTVHRGLAGAKWPLSRYSQLFAIIGLQVQVRARRGF